MTTERRRRSAGSSGRRAAPHRGKTAQGATRRRDARESQQPRQYGVWLNRALVVLAAAVVLAGGTRAWTALESIPVRRITVTGELAHTQAEAVQALVQSSLTGGFLDADLQKMRRELRGLPWIHEVTVRRRWPGALEIHVVEQLAIARWGEDGFLNHEGGIFQSRNSREDDSLPLLEGPPGSAAVLMGKYLRLIEMLAPLDLRVAQLAMDERGQVAAVLGGGMRLVIGSEDFFGRMQRFVAIYREELAARSAEIERVDLRYSTGLAVAFAKPGQVAGL